LESLLRDRLQSTADDEEVQDVARTILRRVDEQPRSMTGVTESSPAACPSEVSHRHTNSLVRSLLTAPSQIRVYIAPPSDGADLYRSDALQGAAAEAAKASFKAHRTETAEDSAPPVSPVSKTSSSSFQTIQDIRASLTKLSADFSLPSSLEFSDDEEDGLAYSSINAPLRSYEHALDDLLVQLDAVESDGDEEVRELRRSAVKEVEKAIEDVERRVREARQVAEEEGNKHDADVAPVATSGTAAQDDEVVGQPESESAAAVDDGKPQEAGPSQPQSDDCEDEACRCSRSSSAVSFSVPDIEVVSPDDVNTSPEPDIVVPPTPSLVAEAEFSCVCSDDDVSKSIDEEATGASPEKSPTAESPAGFATPIVGAIAPSSTPVRPSSVSPDEGLSTPLKFEGDDDEWTEV
jgi:BAG domain